MAFRVFRRGSRGGEMGEFSPPPPPFLLSSLLSFFVSLSLKYRNNIWFLRLRWRMCISDDGFYQSIYSFRAHKHTVKNSPQKLQQFTPHFKILDPRVPLHYCLLFGWYNSLLVALYWFSCPCKLNLMCRVKPSW